MLVLSTAKEGIFTLEICQSQKNIGSFFACVVYAGHIEWSAWYDNLEVATKKGTFMLKSIALTEKCSVLATKYFRASIYHEHENEPEEAKFYLKKHFFYSKRFEARRDMGLWTEGGC
ncbi:MAG: hypothetical protein WAQ98_23395 [Blastocatellia bacterium]